MEDPDRNLALAVIERAIDDVFRTPTGSCRPQLDRREAVEFLTNKTGPEAISRAFWCELAEINPDQLREQISKQMWRVESGLQRFSVEEQVATVSANDAADLVDINLSDVFGNNRAVLGAASEQNDDRLV